MLSRSCQIAQEKDGPSPPANTAESSLELIELLNSKSNKLLTEIPSRFRH